MVTVVDELEGLLVHDLGLDVAQAAERLAHLILITVNVVIVTPSASTVI